MTAQAATAAPVVHRRSPGPVRWRPDGAPPMPERRCAQPGSVPARRRVLAARARRRRLLLAVAALAMLVALALPWGGVGGHSLATSGSVLAGATLTPHSVYVVRPGDTMWSIAERLDPGGDPRAIVSELEQQVGSDTLQPGEHLLLP